MGHHGGRALFVGREGRDVVTFVCLDGGGYGTFRNDQEVGVWGEADFVYAMGWYLRMVERPGRSTGTPDTFQRPVAPVPGSGRRAGGRQPADPPHLMSGRVPA